MEYMNLHAYQLQSRLKPDEGETLPELTRAEYLRMLERAKSDRNERAYLLTKVFACTGLTVQELPKLTLEAAKAGVVERHAGLPAKLPGCLRSELLSYAQRRAIDSGPLFVMRSGRALNRTEVTGTIQRLACAAKIEPGKGNPRCLRKLVPERAARDMAQPPAACGAVARAADRDRTARGGLGRGNVD